MSSASVVELGLASQTPLPVSVSDLSQYLQPDFEARRDNELELQDFSENRTEDQVRLPEDQDLSVSSTTITASSTNVSSLPPVDRGRKAWQFLLGAFTAQAVTWGLPNSFGTLLNAYLQDKSYASQPHASSLLPLIGTLSSGIIYCSGPFIYPFVHRYPKYRRPLMWLGLLLCWSSIFVASFSPKIKELLFFQGALYAIGCSFVYAPSMSFMSEWFVHRRGLANGIMFAGTAVGGLFFPLILPRLIGRFGTLMTLRICSFMVLGLLAPVLPFLRPRLPESRIHGPSPGAREGSEQGRSSWAMEPTFLLAVLANTVQGFAYFIPLLWLPSFASELDLTDSEASLTLALLNGFSVISRIGTGFLTDRFNPLLLGCLISFITSLVTFVFWGLLSGSYAGLLAFGIIYGSVASGWSSLFTGFIKPHSKDNPPLATSLHGLFLFTRGLGNILSTPISTALSKKHTGSSGPGHGNHSNLGFKVADGRYEKLILYSGTCFAAASIVALFGWMVEGAKLRRDRRQTIHEDTFI